MKPWMGGVSLLLHVKNTLRIKWFAEKTMTTAIYGTVIAGDRTGEELVKELGGEDGIFPLEESLTGRELYSPWSVSAPPC